MDSSLGAVQYQNQLAHLLMNTQGKIGRRSCGIGGTTHRLWVMVYLLTTHTGICSTRGKTIAVILSFSDKASLVSSDVFVCSNPANPF